MGLLDNAIREHLEFKRLHGADPSEVARQEHEALGPVHRGEESAPAEHAEAGHPNAAEGSGEQRGVPTSLAPPSGTAPSQSLAHIGEETAELDMRTVLKSEQLVRAAPTPVGTDSARTSAEESLEWEVPGDSSKRREGVENGGPAGGAADPAGEAVEDVLEETPDFLRETPDQERLWFEQQPPRDFDFEK